MIFNARNIFRLYSIITILLLTGCGGGGGRTYQTTGVAEEEIPTTKGDSLIITTTGNGDTNITYVEVEDGGIYIDCGTGGCGDIYIGVEVEDVEVDTGGY